MDKLTQSQIGRIGQGFAQFLAAQGGMTANAVQDDVHGWDCLLELKSKPKRPYDRATPVPKFFVQVKATTGNAKSAKIKLSNWQSMVNHPAPWFVVAIRLSKRGEPKDVFVVHINESWIEKALKALRQCEKLPYQETMNVTWKPEDRLPELHGDALRDVLQRHVGADTAAYEYRKRAFARSVGYGARPTTMKLSIPDSEITSYADAMLGLNQKVGFDRLEIVERRFEIDGPSTVHVGGSFQVKPNAASACIRAISLDGTERVAATALRFATGRLPVENQDRARFQAGPLNLIVHLPASSKLEAGHVLSISMSWDWQTPCSVEELGDAAAIYRLTFQQGTVIELVADSDAPDHVTSAHVDGVEGAGATAGLWGELEAAARVLRRLGLQNMDADPSLAEGYPQFSVLDGLLSGRAEKVVFRVEVPEGVAQAAVVLPPTAVIGNFAIVCVAALMSAPEYSGELAAIRGTSVRVESVDVVRQDAIESFDLASRVDAFVKKLETEYGDSMFIAIVSRESPMLMQHSTDD